MNTTLPNTKDLSTEPPRSARERIHDYAIIARTLDKCRASIAGMLGEYYSIVRSTTCFSASRK